MTKNPKALALAGASALLLTAAYSVHSSSNGDDKAALRAAKRQYLQAKKEALLQTPTSAYAAPGESQYRARGGSQPGHSFANATPLGIIQDSIASAAGAAATSGSAAAQEFCSEVAGSIDPLGDIDVYSVVLRKGDLLQVAVVSEGQGAPQDPLLTVYGPQNLANPGPCGKGKIAEADDEFGLNMSTLDPCTFFQAPEEGTYFIQVEDVLGARFGTPASRTYKLSTCVGLHKETEPNDVVAEPLALIPNPSPLSAIADCVSTARKPTSGAASSSSTTTAIGCSAPPATGIVYGQIAAGIDKDCFAISLQANQVLQARVEGAQCANDLGVELDPQITVSGPGGSGAFNDDTDGTDPRVLFTAPTAGTYVLCINSHSASFNGVYGYYKLVVDTLCNNEGLGDLDGNNDCATADPLLTCKAAGGPTTSSSK